MIQLFCALFKICFQTFGARDFRCGNVLQKNEFLMQPLVLFFGIRYNLAIMKMSFPKSIKRFLVMGALLPLVFLSCLSTPKQDSPGDSNGTRSSANSSEDEKSSLKDVNISVISSPKETSKGKGVFCAVQYSCGEIGRHSVRKPFCNRGISCVARCGFDFIRKGNSRNRRGRKRDFFRAHSAVFREIVRFVLS